MEMALHAMSGSPNRRQVSGWSEFTLRHPEESQGKPVVTAAAITTTRHGRGRSLGAGIVKGSHIYYPSEVRRGEYWGSGVFLLQ